MIERLNRTYKASYRPTNGFHNIDGANYDLSLWVAYYNFLRPHKHNRYQVLNKVDTLNRADNMPGKWQLLIFLGQQTILNLQAKAFSPYSPILHILLSLSIVLVELRNLLKLFLFTCQIALAVHCIFVFCFQLLIGKPAFFRKGSVL